MINMLDQETRKTVLKAQGNEITEYHIYRKLASCLKEEGNKKILEKIADDELRHYNFWKKYTKRDVKPDKLKIGWYYLISRILGLTFGVKLMEKGEEQAQVVYERISSIIPEAKKIVEDEDMHEIELINMIDEEKLKYVGSIVLGLNDALVELTGALAGFTFALQKTELIAMAGLVTGIAASLSMAASEYLSTKTEESGKEELKASMYTGFAYLATVVFLIYPYFIFNNVYLSLGNTLFNAVIVIALFNYYISIAKDIPFRRRFLEMASISLGVAALTFVVGFIVRLSFGV
ncbi:MAG: rubrerythrin family protein [Candidatus Altiarchaeales archaeon ex4484_2]|nr:MAG: rubrerythrin family protein [Candidatus Altiarchaeales archaeon ex4484_2]